MCEPASCYLGNTGLDLNASAGREGVVSLSSCPHTVTPVMAAPGLASAAPLDTGGVALGSKLIRLSRGVCLRMAMRMLLFNRSDR